MTEDFGSHQAGFIHCAHPGCTAKIKDHRWGRTKATGWFVTRDEAQAWCPDHLPEWVPAWRARRGK